MKIPFAVILPRSVLLVLVWLILSGVVRAQDVPDQPTSTPDPTSEVSPIPTVSPTGEVVSTVTPGASEIPVVSDTPTPVVDPTGLVTVTASITSLPEQSPTQIITPEISDVPMATLPPTPTPIPTPITVVATFDDLTEEQISFIPVKEEGVILGDQSDLPADVKEKAMLQRFTDRVGELIGSVLDVLPDQFSRRRLRLKMVAEDLRTTDSLELEVEGEYKNAEILLTDSNHQVIGVSARLVDRFDKQVLEIERPRQFKPGKYRLEVTQEGEMVIEQDFSWGVLAMNLNKSIYHPNEYADLAFAVLNDRGDMVCDAVVSLKIEGPHQVDDLTTVNGGIKVNPECEQHGFTQKPDYEARYQFGRVGSYELELTSSTWAGTHTISETIEVVQSISYDVERLSATRIYPPAVYPMTIKIKPDVDFSGKIAEKIPLVFDVRQIQGRTINTRTVSFDGGEESLTMNLIDLDSSQMVVIRHDDYQTIEWQVNLKKGDELELRYVYDMPDISPQFYLLGPLRMLSDAPGQIVAEGVFNEYRSWQLAADALSNYSFVPTGGGTVTVGAAPARLAATASVNTGVNTGNWQGALADDNLHWSVVGAGATGVNFYLDVDGVQLNGANKILIQTEIDLDATALQTAVQICDWTSNTSVDAAADAQCTNGGWRSLNSQTAANADVLLNFTAAGQVFQWHLYDGYFTTGTAGGAPVATPLTNFVQSGTNRVRIRFYSTTNAASAVDIDFLRIVPIVDSVYHPADFNNLGSGTPAGTYANAQVVGNSATAQQSTTTSNAISLDVPGTAGSVSDFYLSFNNVETYTGMNTIYVKADYRCSVASNDHRPKIWNFVAGGGQWEDLTTASIACSTTDATNAWAKNNITISDYVSNGEVRIGWRTLANGTQAVRLDFVYIILGTTNTDSGECEITFGTGTATNCTNTRDLDVTGTSNVWANPAQDESNTHDKDFYALDSDGDATTEEATAANLDFSVTIPDGVAIVGVNYAGRFEAGSQGTNPDLTVQMGVRDYSGIPTSTAGNGGWTQIGATDVDTTYVYTDTITALLINTYGMQNNAEDFVNVTSDEMNLRLKTTAAGSTGTNATTNWDFAMVSLQWRENISHPSVNYQYAPTSGSLIEGSEVSRLAATATANTGVNTGSWKGTLADDNMHWTVRGLNPGGFEVHLNIDNVILHGANKMLVQTEFDTDAALSIQFQICDRVSTAGVDAAADGECTGGGWRSLNTQDASNADVLFTGNGADSMQWQIYDGYWSTGDTGGIPVATPLSNFVTTDANRRVKIRYISTTNSATNFDIDFLRLQTIIDSVYNPAGFTNLGSGTPAGTYVNAVGIGHLVGGQQSLATSGTVGDNILFAVPGTAGSASDFYLSFRGVRTYAGMNTILVRAEYSCSANTNTHRPKIWNFAAGGGAGAWEDLTTASIACATTANIQSQFAKNNVTIEDYVSNGELRIGWRTLANGTEAVRLDWIYAMVGATNADTGNCQVSFGTGTATNCSHTRDLDPLGTTSTFTNTAEDESNTFGHDFIAFDTDQDGTTEEATSSNFDVPIALIPNTFVVGVNFAAQFAAGTAGATAMTVQAGIRDYAGVQTSTTGAGGWVLVGASTTGTTQVFTDTLSAMTVAAYGVQNNPDDLVDLVNGRMNIRLRTTAAGSTATNAQTEWDFALVSAQWVDTTTNVQGVVYMTDESTLGTSGNGGPCDGSTAVVSIRINGGTANTASCSASTAAFEITTQAAAAWSDKLALYLTSSLKANTVYLSNGTSNQRIDLYENTLAIGHLNSGPIAVVDLVDYDNDQNSGDMLFDAENASPDTLATESNIEIHVRSNETLDSGGDVDTSGASGDLHVDDGAIMEVDTATSTINGDVLVNEGGTWRVNADATINGSDITMSGTSPVVTTTSGTPTVLIAGGGSIGGGTTPSITFYNLGTSGSGVTTISNNAAVNNDVAVATGTTLRNNADLTIGGGDLTTTSTGAIDYTSGTPTVFLNNTGNLGGGSGAITFYTLDLGDDTADTTTLNSAISANNQLVVSDNQTFTVGSNGVTVGSSGVTNSGTISVGSGASYNQTGGTTTVRTSSGAGSIPIGGAGTTTFYNLNVGSDPTDNLSYSFITAGTILVSNDLIVQDGGTGSHVFNVNSADHAVTVGDDFVVDPNATYSASSNTSNSLTIAGNFTNNDTFTANAGRVVFNNAAKISTLLYAADTSFGDFVVTTGGKSMQFDNVDRTTITGAFTVQGTDCTTGRVFLDSVVDDDQWDINATGTVSVNAVDVEDSNAITALLATEATEDDYQSNANWTFDRGTCGSISFAISDNVIGYGALSSASSRYATGDAVGAGSETEAHTITVSSNAPGGYSVLVNGNAPSALAGPHTIAVIGGTNTAPTLGTEQFGLRMNITAGSGTVTAPYDGSGFAYDAEGVVYDQVAAGFGDGVTTVYSVRYVGNISSSTEASPYTATINYVVTGEF